MDKRDYVYANSDEKYAKTVLIYANDYDLYYDEEFTEHVTADDLKELFMADLTLVWEDKLVKPISFINNRLQCYVDGDGVVEFYPN